MTRPEVIEYIRKQFESYQDKEISLTELQELVISGVAQFCDEIIEITREMDVILKKD